MVVIYKLFEWPLRSAVRVFTFIGSPIMADVRLFNFLNGGTKGSSSVYGNYRLGPETKKGDQL